MTHPTISDGLAAARRRELAREARADALAAEARAATCGVGTRALLAASDLLLGASRRLHAYLYRRRAIRSCAARAAHAAHHARRLGRPDGYVVGRVAHHDAGAGAAGCVDVRCRGAMGAPCGC